jgi:hypothetical protein
VSPHIADFSGELRKIHRVLGGLTEALLAGRAETLVFDLGEHAVDPGLLGPLSRWNDRNGREFRTRVRAAAYVMPSRWARFQWWLVSLLERPPVPTAIVRTREEALEWLAMHGNGA